MRLIDADAMIEKLENAIQMYDPELSYDRGYADAIEFVIGLADGMGAVEEAVRHGEWVNTDPDFTVSKNMSRCTAYYKCSECGRRTGISQTRTYKYCPRCGARMDGDEQL